MNLQQQAANKLLDKEHQEHLDSILTQFTQLCAAKYIKGNTEHGGFLPDKDGLLDMAIDEVVDLAVYLLTLKQQLKELVRKIDE